MINASDRASLRVDADRRSIRLRNHDYTRPGFYFITLCSIRGASLFGQVQGRSVHLSEIGEVVRDCWREIPTHFPNVHLDAFVLMPDHVHGIVVILGDRRGRLGSGVGGGAQHAAPLRCAHAEPAPLRCTPVDLAPLRAHVEVETSPRVMSNSRGPSKSPAVVIGRVAPGSLGAIVRSFKSAVTRAVNIKRGTPGAAVWQRGYWERVIRDDVELRNIRRYIATNPTRAATREERRVGTSRSGSI